MPEDEVRRPDREGDERVREDAKAHDPGEREDRAEERAGEAGQDAERSEISEQQVLCHVEREQLGLADLGDRRRDGERRSPMPRAKRAMRQPGTGWSRRASVRARTAYATAMRTIGASWRGSNVQLVSRDGSSTSPDCTLGPWAGEQTYEAAGVSIAKADAVVERLRAAVESTGATGFGGVRRAVPAGRRAAARRVDRLGRDEARFSRASAGRCVRAAMTSPRTASTTSITTGADPLFFLDYVAANRIDLEEVAELVEGAAEVCREAGCALIGGETAELPGIYREDELDFAGTCVGMVARDRLIDCSVIEAGDAIVGFPSAGVHANGFTLVRRVLEVEDYAGPDLLAPTRLYLGDVRALRERTTSTASPT